MAENPMSCSRLMTPMANPHANRIGTRGRGSITRRFPSRAVGMVSSSRFSAKYEAKKMQSTILASSTGWNENAPACTHSLAPLMFSPRWGTNGRSKKATPAANSRYRYRSRSRDRRMTARVTT